MRTIFFIGLMLIMVGCGSKTETIVGQDGFNSLVDMARTGVDALICESESGLVVNSGLDLDRDNSLDSTEIVQTQVVCDGTNGEDGQDGVDGEDGQDADSNFFIVEVHDPCGDKPGHPDEVILELEDGSFVAWYKNLGLSVLDKNVHYRTTDKQKCDFKIDSNGNIVEL